MGLPDEHFIRKKHRIKDRVVMDTDSRTILKENFRPKTLMGCELYPWLDGNMTSG